jgi:hypothetical protein
VSFFTRDVFSVANIPVYGALLSNVGILLWCASATLCLFTATAVRGGARRFYVGFGVLALLLLADDFFMLHEWIVPRLTGLPESAVAAAYVVLMALLLVGARREVAAHEPRLLGLALALFGASVALDVIERPPAPAWHYLGEEGLKLLGIVTWLVYVVRACDRERGGAAAVREPWNR